MKTYKTRYGELRNISFDDYYDNGVLKECLCEENCILHATIGDCIPKYDRREVRAKNRNSLSFYKSGRLKSIYLQEQIDIQTPIGLCKAEFITFYENETIHRVFPRYGQISGYWSEEEEMELLEPFSSTINGIKFDNKITGYCFYSSGKIKSVTLGKGEEVSVETPIGIVKARIGLSFYEDGNLASIEPSQPEAIKTPIDIVVAYDNAPVGIHGDQNSVKFTKEGVLSSLKTIMSGVELISLNNEKGNTNFCRMLPERKRSMVDIEQFEMVPIEIKFKENSIEILDSNGKQQAFSFSDYIVKSIYNPYYRDSAVCSHCESCNGCHK